MQEGVSFTSKFGKSIVAFLFTLYTVLVPLLSGDNRLDGAEWVVFAIALGNNLLVFFVPVSASFASAKTIINAVLAGLAVLQTVLGGGVDMSEIALVVGAVLAALGVAVAPAFSPAEGIRVPAGSDSPIPA